MREIFTIKERILEYLEFKGVTKYKYSKDTGTSNGILTQKNGITEKVLLTFLKYAKDINVNWLMLNKGSMLIGKYATKETLVSEVSEPISSYGKKVSTEEPKTLTQYKREYNLQKDRIKSLEKQLEQSAILISTLNNLANDTKDQKRSA